MSNALVKVTQEDIDNGVNHNCFNCPISLAIYRALNYPAGYVMTQVESIWVNGVEYAHSETTFKFMRNFDQGFKDKIAPFSFNLNSLRRKN